jgi:hypothetical protein
MLSEQMSPPRHGNATPDLRRNCPICGNPYRPGEGVLALACLSFGTSAVPSVRTVAAYDPSGQVILGHHGCVLPRLLTLLADFQPEARFVTALSVCAAAAAFSPEPHHDEP